MNGYIKVIERIKATAQKAGRAPEDIKLVVVTKTRTVDEILKIYQQGHRAFAENRIQEAAEKIPHLPADIEWHLIGHLQTNKAKQAVELFNFFQSLDSEHLAQTLAKFGENNNKTINCLIEVKISDEETKYGVDYEETPRLISEISKLNNIRILGLMGMAPFTDDKDKVRASFKKLRNLFEEIKKSNLPNVEMKWLSMGMSSDFEIAIEEGANMVRIGTAVFEN